MLKVLVVFILLIIAPYCLVSQINAPNITTKWAQLVDMNEPLQEYPRPQMVRSKWKNLNGQWDYAITKRMTNSPKSFGGKITVPYAIESYLSGVQKKVASDEVIWYKTNFNVPSSWKNKNILLHFGAVDWEATIFINGKEIGAHQGGYDPFSFDISGALNSSGPQELKVRVWDPSSEGTQPRGKQVSRPEGIWYTPVSGIWQTVWLEPIPKQSIRNIRITPDIDAGKVEISVTSNQKLANNYSARIHVLSEGKKVASTNGPLGSKINISIPNATLWSPDHPFLYDLEVELLRNGKRVDKVSSYFGMRKIATKKDEEGHLRFTLNNEILFQYGTLDQGWWPDGLYTAPTDEALAYDIKMTKQLGFNTIRKHVKVESARWYYHCDKLGMLVWQDMPNGDKSADWRGPSGYDGREMVRTAQSEHQYYTEWKRIMDAFYNNPSIVMWVPFNEAWGQFKTVEVINWTMDYDPSRLVNGPSGGNFFAVGHTVDEHQYPGPSMPKANLHAPDILNGRVLLLGEFGGLGLPIKDHLWQKDKNWGYRNLTGKDELFQSYKKLIDQMPPLINKGLAAAIYTQTTDVEGEVNGLMTYDRKIVKMNMDKVNEINKNLINHDLDKR